MSGRPEEAIPLGTNGQPTSRLGHAIRAWRRYRGLKGVELAERAGLSGPGHLSRIEHGDIQTISDERLNRIAMALDVPPSFLTSCVLPSAPQQDVQDALPFIVVDGVGTIQPDDSLVDYTDPNFEISKIRQWLPILIRHRVDPIKFDEVPTSATTLQLGKDRWRISPLARGERVTRVIYNRMAAVLRDGVPIEWWLKGEHRLPSMRHEFASKTIFIGIIRTETDRGAWYSFGKWLQ